MPGHLNPPEGGGDARRRQQRCGTVQKDGCRILTWSVQTLVLVPAEIRYLQALISVLQPRLSRLGGPEPMRLVIPTLTTEVLTWQILSAWTEHWATMKKPGGQTVHLWHRG